MPLRAKHLHRAHLLRWMENTFPRGSPASTHMPAGVACVQCAMNATTINADTQGLGPTDVLQVDRIEAARLLRYSPATFDRLVKRGLVRANRAVGRPRFSLEELRRFVVEGSRPA